MNENYFFLNLTTIKKTHTHTQFYFFYLLSLLAKAKNWNKIGGLCHKSFEEGLAWENTVWKLCS